MASIEKYTNDAICAMLRHNSRQIKNSINKDIDRNRSKENKRFPMDHNGLTDMEYYKQLIKTKYIYGRGTLREKEAITGCSWVITLPKELYGDKEKEEAFFRAVFEFVSNRYGAQNIINNAVHYDEAGLPHIHILFSPVTVLDHDLVRFKTVKSKRPVRLDSGRYEYAYNFKYDADGNRIALKNYAKASDAYDEKISANDVINKAELAHFHSDLQSFLDANGIAGHVVTGQSSGINFSVRDLKEFSAKTGLRLDDVKSLIGEKSLLESVMSSELNLQKIQEMVEEKDRMIASLKEKLEERTEEINPDEPGSIWGGFSQVETRNKKDIEFEEEKIW